jgi:release factor glutamine methyltransferase
MTSLVLTVREWLQRLTQLRSQSDTLKLDAMLFLRFLSGRTHAWLIAHTNEPLLIDEEKNKKNFELFANGVPMAYLLGKQEFWSLALKVNSATLIPRPETESLVEWILRKLPAMPLDILDLGTGSGAIALALKSERESWNVVATDQSKAALEIAMSNAKALDLEVEFLQGSWWQAVPGRLFDCIVSNPPYIAKNDSHLRSLRYEPVSALVAGVTGLDDLSTIAQGVYHHLKEAGWLVMEHGYDQQTSIIELLKKSGLIKVTGYQDLSGQDRFVVGQKGKI